MTADRFDRIPSLDGWRAIAIVIVLADHVTGFTGVSFSWFKATGHHGVAIFFVLSGYLITSRLLVELRKTGRCDLGSFYIRRCFRLWPCAWIYLSVISILGGMHPGELRSCLLFYRNFGPYVPQLFTAHFWSLSVEEQFYLSWPLLLITFRAKRASWVAAVLVLCAVPFSSSIHVWPYAALLIGCITAFIPTGLSTCIPRILHRFLFTVGLICILSFPFVFRQAVPLYECAAIAFLIWSTAGPALPGVTSIMEFRPIAQIGVFSYSLYVWQQIFAIFNMGRDGQTVLKKLLLIGIVATASYYCVERPMIRFGSRLFSRSKRRPTSPAQRETMELIP